MTKTYMVADTAAIWLRMTCGTCHTVISVQPAVFSAPVVVCPLCRESWPVADTDSVVALGNALRRLTSVKAIGITVEIEMPA